MICEAALPAEIFSCSAGVFFSKMVSLKKMVLHYPISLLEVVKDEEEDAVVSMCVCETMSVWSELGLFSESLMEPRLG